MFQYQSLMVTICIVWLMNASASTVNAQRIYFGSTPADAQYSATGGIDSNGRAINVDGITYDRYGQNVDDYRWSSRYARFLGHAAGTYYTGGYYGIGYPGVLGGYSGGYATYVGDARMGVATTYITPPRIVIVGGVAPTRTVMNNATRGSVIEYTHNGNGYISTPGSSYQTVISNGPSIFPYTTVVQPTQPPVLIEARPIPVASKTFSGTKATSDAGVRAGSANDEIKLICPNEATGSLSYILNGTTYAIKPGYSQTFADDRRWTIEFFRGGNGSSLMRYDLKAGTYQFVADDLGWDLKGVSLPAATFEIPPPPAPLQNSTLAPTPASDL